MSDPHRQTLLSSQGDEEDTSFRSSADSSRLPSAAASPAVEINNQHTKYHTGGALTVLDGLAIVLGIQIGVGIFSIPSYVSVHVPSPGAGVLVWFLAGLLVWTGAASFVELGAAIPRNGGIQEYLRYCYGDFGGFMFSWTWISIGRPCSISLIAMIFAEHVNGLVLPDGWAGGWVNKGTAMMGIWIITIVNCLGAYTGAHVALGFLVLKISTILSIIGAGVVLGLRGKGEGVGKGNSGWFIPERTSDDEGGSAWATLGDYVTALFAALWVYGGWETVSYSIRTYRNVQVITWLLIFVYTKDRLCWWGDEEPDPRYTSSNQWSYEHCRLRVCLNKYGRVHRVTDVAN
jgi:amino acid transporter